MGSTGDRAASLIIGGARGACGGKRLRQDRWAFRPPLLPIISNSDNSGLSRSDRGASGTPERAWGSINLPTAAYDGVTEIVLKKQRLLMRVLGYRALIKPLHLCTLGDGKG
jgi:hypothetical protein